VAWHHRAHEVAGDLWETFMRTHRLVATVGVVALSLMTAACHSKSASSAASTTGASSAAAPSTSAAAAPASSAATAAPTGAAPPSAAPASSQAPSSTAASSAAASAPAAAGSGAVTFDGDYSGKLTSIVCVGSGPTTTASFNAAFTGQPGTFPGDISSTEFGFQGPADTDFDSGFLNNALDTGGKGFVLDGIVAKDEGGKSVTMHGTLVCP
jgi:hypothetical protein